MASGQGRRQVKKCAVDTHGKRAECEPITGSGADPPVGSRGDAPARGPDPGQQSRPCRQPDAVYVVCRATWRVMNDTNALGASDSFTVPDVETCLDECTRATDCVAVDVNVDVRPPLCWPHHRASDLEDRNIFSQPGTNLYQLTGSCASGKQQLCLSRAKRLSAKSISNNRMGRRLV